jgi:hypothetical protein
MEKDTWKVWLFRWLLLTCLGIGGWFAQQVWQGQKDIVVRLNRMDVDQAAVNSSRFTAMDWVVAKAALDNQMNINERRIFKLETSFDMILRSQERIEGKLGTK